MNLLLDTHLLLWTADDPERLSDEVKAMLLNAEARGAERGEPVLLA